MAWRFLTSGESHGRGLLVVVDGLPAGLSVSRDDLSGVMARRRRGFGRGGRKNVERDELTLWGGIRNGLTTGGPVGISIDNAEWEHWDVVMNPWSISPAAEKEKAVTAPRPGHADLSGSIKFGVENMRNILERASARTTAPRTLAGALAALVLKELGVTVRSAVDSIGGVAAALPAGDDEWRRAALSDLGVAREEDELPLKARITAAAEQETSLGGTFVVSVTGLPAGIGSFTEWDGRLDGRLAGALMAIPAVKGVEVGDGFRSAARAGRDVHDPIFVEDGRWTRKTNHAGGIEGGMSTGQEIVIRAAMKPIPTMRKGLLSFDTVSGKPSAAHSERSDVCAVPAACVVGEAMTAWVVGSMAAEQFGSDRMQDLKERFEAYRKHAERWNLHDCMPS
ncbi:chorismate synthase [Aminivibrio sp.]|uniref:chorismate synthase n=1 Tax=Aminivibrio sp. TaxID=1872489 RepID=UPI001A46F57A|nr:chorismate synthase [Aminivibrio sp.]MBL3540558.1 chorismate synthase [Aminivibrio sp.]